MGHRKQDKYFDWSKEPNNIILSPLITPTKTVLSDIIKNCERQITEAFLIPQEYLFENLDLNSGANRIKLLAEYKEKEKTSLVTTFCDTEWPKFDIENMYNAIATSKELEKKKNSTFMDLLQSLSEILSKEELRMLLRAFASDDLNLLKKTISIILKNYQKQRLELEKAIEIIPEEVIEKDIEIIEEEVKE